MKKLSVLLILILAGCNTLSPEQKAERQAQKLITKYGPQCEMLGVSPDSPEYAGCIIQLYQARIARGANGLKAYENVQRSMGLR